MGRIEYRPPVSTPIQFLSVRGTIPTDRMRTLSFNPFIILPAGTFTSQQIFIPICASAFIQEVGGPLLFPMQLTFDIAVSPLLEMSPQPAGGGMVTAGLVPYMNNFELAFNVNNINTGADVTNLVWKAVADSPGALINPVPYEIIYLVRTQLTP